MNEQEEAFLYSPAAPAIEFQSFPKMARLNREVIVSEKIDGTNAQIFIVPTTELSAGSMYPSATAIEDFSKPGSVAMFVGSRNRWITPSNDNFGFARWCMDNVAELRKLGTGRHFGEWWGGSIQRGYGLKEKRFSLFDVHRWLPNFDLLGQAGIQIHPGVIERVDDFTGKPGPNCCHVVPRIWKGNFDSFDARDLVEILRSNGSFAAPGFMRPEGIVLYHTAADKCFKVTLEGDEKPKGLLEPISSAQLTAGKEAADEVFRQKCKTT